MDTGTSQKKTDTPLRILVRRQRRGNNEEREERLEVISERRIVFSECQVLLNNFLSAEKKVESRTGVFSRFGFFSGVRPFCLGKKKSSKMIKYSQTT